MENNAERGTISGRVNFLTNFELNSKKIAFHSSTMFYIEVGKGKKGSYKVKYSFKGNLIQAVAYYNTINIGNGYKKRLRMEDKTLDVQRS